MNTSRIVISTKDFDIFESGFVSITNKDITIKDVIKYLLDEIDELHSEIVELKDYYIYE